MREDQARDPRLQGEQVTGKARNAGEPDRSSSSSDVTGYAASDGAGEITPETAAIRSDIEQTRSNITDTVEAIQQKLSPSNVMAETIDSVRETTRQRARQVAAAASETASQVAETSRRVGGEVADRTRQASDEVVRRTRAAAGSAASTARENPWMTAAVVAGIGAAAWYLLSRDNVETWEADDLDDDLYTEESLYYEEDDDYADEGRSPRLGVGAASLVAAGIGVGYYLLNRQRAGASDDTWSEASDYGADAGSYRSFDESAGEWRDEAGGAATRARDAVSDAAGRAREAVSTASDRARQVVSSASQRAREAVGDASQRGRQVAARASAQAGAAGRRARSEFATMLDERPLVVGAAALAVGAAVGFAIPVSRSEQRLMGGARDQLMRRARAMAGDAVNRARDKARQVASDASHAMNETRTSGGDLRDDERPI